MTLNMLTENLPCYQFDGWYGPISTKTNLKHGFFTTVGGVSSGLYESLNCSYGSEDIIFCIEENRRRVAAGLGFTKNQLFGLKQCHSNTAMLLSANSSFLTDNRPKADAYVSTQKNAALAILTADCIPVLFADRDNSVVGAAHAGWRGATGGILNSTIKMMCENGAHLNSIETVVGPAIAKSNYQVGDDCRETVLNRHPGANHFFLPDRIEARKYYFDLPAFAVWQLRRIGLKHIVNLAIDTYDIKNRLFSHRRATHEQLADTGRQISIIGLID